MEILNHAKDVYEIKNFISDKEINELLSFVNLNGEEEGWKFWHEGNTLCIYETEYDKQNIESLFKQIASNVELLFANYKMCTGFQHVRRIKSGEYFPLHQDENHKETDLDKIVFGVVIYLNENFEGGELNYPDLNLKIQPRKGSLVIHKAEYFHEVLPVLNGNRYCITTFIRGTDKTQLAFK